MKTRILLAVASAAALAGCGGATRERKVEAAGAGPVAAVTVVEVANETWPSLYETTGTVRARSTSLVAAKIMAYIREVKVDAGSHVRAGQLLATLDTRDLDVNSRRAEAAREEVRTSMPEAEHAIAAAKAQLDLAQVTFHRMQELFQKKSVSNQEFDEASARLQSAQAAWEMAKARRAQLDSKLAEVEQEVRAAEVTRSYAEVSAPFAGVVVAKTAESGAMAIPGAPLFTIEAEGAYRLEAPVDEAKLTAIRVGQAVTVTLDGVDRAVEARVSEIMPEVDAESRAYTVKIDLPAMTAMRTGLFGRARFRLGERTALAAPEAAVMERGQLQSVMVAENGEARTRLVTLGERAAGKVEVLSGLSAGESVIVPLPPGLSDAAKVEVRR